MKTRTRIVFAGYAGPHYAAMWHVVDAEGRVLFGPARWKACVAWRKGQ